MAIKIPTGIPNLGDIDVVKSAPRTLVGPGSFLAHKLKVETDGPTRVGSRAREKRQVPGGVREMTYEITKHDPPHRVSFRGIDGPVRVVGAVTVSPVDGGGSRVSLEIDLVGHRLGKLLVPMARSQLRKQVPLDQQRLKERLEAR